MKKKDLKKAAILGLSTGLLMLAQNNLSAFEDVNSTDIEFLMAKVSCKNIGDACGSELEKNLKKKDHTDDKKSDHKDKKAHKKDENKKDEKTESDDDEE